MPTMKPIHAFSVFLLLVLLEVFLPISSAETANSSEIFSAETADSSEIFSAETANSSATFLEDAEENTGRFQVIRINYKRVQLPFDIAVWLLFATLIKIGFRNSTIIAGIIPFSALEILLGFLIGFVLLIRYSDAIKMTPNLFFMYLLPPIVFEAGYVMPLDLFFGNLAPILSYAVIGTLWAVGSIGVSLYLLSLLGLFSTATTFLNLLLFCSVIAAVDPVAVLTIFEEVQVDQLLFICVFGESLLNDAVTVVLYHMFEDFLMIGEENLLSIDIIAGVASFFVVSLGGLLVGLIWAAVTALVTKYTNHIRVVQPLICLLFPYLAYLTAELFRVSGIISVVFCAMAMRPYVNVNVSRSSNTTVLYFLKTAASISETVIFIFLGISTITQSELLIFDFPFIVFSIFFCLFYRFIGVYVMTFILNRLRFEKISATYQTIMAYGGLRGAVAYGLAVSLPELTKLEDKTARMYLTTTILICLFTVFIQGSTIRPLVSLLKVKRHEHRNVPLPEGIFTHTAEGAVSAMEVISDTNHSERLLSRLNQWTLYRFLVHKSRRLGPNDILLSKFRDAGEEDAKMFTKRDQQDDYGTTASTKYRKLEEEEDEDEEK